MKKSSDEHESERPPLTEWQVQGMLVTRSLLKESESEILNLLQDYPEGLSAEEIRMLLDKHNVGDALYNLREKKILKREEPGEWHL